MPPPPSDHILEVGRFTRQLRTLLEGHFPEVWLRGEVSNLRRQSSGHTYFSLKDSSAQISAVLFRGSAARIAVSPREGSQLIVGGEISVYEPRGNYQLIVREIYEDGIGRLREEFERLKRALAAEGIFESERKRAIPTTPRTIAFVTSPSGAALRDFVSVLRRYLWSGRLLVIPSRVQGQGAASEIVRGIELAASLPAVDLIVTGRGGGSLEDLWPFNEEIVARAVAACPKPLISAVGHEIDFTLSDLAADLRAETPTAAAEIIGRAFARQVDRLSQAERDLWRLVRDSIDRQRNRIDLMAHRLTAGSPERRLERFSLRVDDLERRAGDIARQALAAARQDLADTRYRLRSQSPEAALREFRQRLLYPERNLHRLPRVQLRQFRERVRQIETRLAASSPASILKRGFSIVRNPRGEPVTTAGAARRHRQLVVEFQDDSVPVDVDRRPRQSELTL